jgi:hypothetical protein
MKIRVTRAQESGQRIKRKTYRQARKSALARLRKAMDLQWTPPRSRDELRER